MTILLKRGVLATLLSLIVVVSARAEMVLPVAASPAEVGMSAEQFKRIEAAMQAQIDAGVLPGVQMLVARKGKIAWQATLGVRELEKKEQLPADAIFRIYSMTKPLTSVAAMSLVEEGRLQITDPVAKFLPEIGAMKVGTEKPGSEGKPILELTAPARPMTVQDLLRHTAGFTYGEFGRSLVHQAYLEAKIGDHSLTNAQFVEAIAKMPLRFSPGARFEYGRSTDVLGRVLEVIEGKSLREILAGRITGPLGMKDTGFSVPADKMGRVAMPRMEAFYNVDGQRTFEGGGEGLQSTMADYLRFSLMMARGGTLNGKRVIGRQTVSFMTSDHLGATPGFASGRGFGLGFSVRTRQGEAGLPGSIGEYSWAGYAGTMFWIDPKEEMIAIYMSQVAPANREMLRNKFVSMVQAALVD